MKLQPIAIATFTVLAAATLLTAGPLDPPTGDIAPTYKTLNDIEPRIPLSLSTTPGDADSMFRIAARGSYYLAGNLNVSAANVSAIEIAASNVTIDLNGYSINSVNTAAVIRVSTGTAIGITIRDGSIIGGGYGIDLAPAGVGAGERGLIERINVSNSSAIGMRVGVGFMISDCHVAGCTLDGMVVGAQSTLLRVGAIGNFRSGIVAGAGVVITDCVSSFNSSMGFDLGAGPGATISRSLASTNMSDGFLAWTGSTIDACTAHDNSADGFDVTGTTITGSTSFSNQTGIRAVDSTLRGLSAYNNTYGIVCDVSNVIECSANSNGTEGITCTSNSLVQSCVVARGRSGITVGSDCTVRGNSSNSHFGPGGGFTAGITVNGSGNLIENNACSDNERGIQVLAANNVLRRNMCANNTDNNWYIVASNNVAPIIIPNKNTALITGSLYSGNFGATDPESNISY